MIVFDLQCSEQGHRFEGWFGSSDDFASQQKRGLVCCPHCGSADINKAPMAPAVPRKGNSKALEVAPTASVAANGALPPEAAKMMQALAKMQAEALKQSRWVGDSFADESRAMHYGEKDAAPIHGAASVDEAKALIDEGIEIAPLPFPVAPPDKQH